MKDGNNKSAVCVINDYLLCTTGSVIQAWQKDRNLTANVYFTATCLIPIIGGNKEGDNRYLL